MKTLVISGTLAAFLAPAAARADENYEIAKRQMDEVVKEQPAPAPGVEKAPVRAPAWCGQPPKNYTFEQALDSTRSQLGGLDRYWMDALLGAAERLCDADPKEQVTQRAAAFIEQHWMNRLGVASADAAEAIRLRLSKDAFEEGKKKLCAALTVSEEIEGPERKHNAAKRDLFDCGGDSVKLVATAPMLELVPWLDSSGIEPDEMVRLAYVALEAGGTLGSEDYRDKSVLFYVMDQYDYQAFQPGKVLALLQNQPYKDNPYATVVTKEALGGYQLNRALVEAEVKKRVDQDPDWKELLITAPQRGFAAWAAEAAQWKAELQRSSEMEQKAFGPSRKALAGCTPMLEKDLAAVLKSLKHGTAEELKHAINDSLIAGLLLYRYAVCVAVDGDPNVAAAFVKQLFRELRVTRGPRAAGYYAALDALSKIKEDRTKFPVEPNTLPANRRNPLDELLLDILSSSKKKDAVGFDEVQKGVVKTSKKGPKGMVVTFSADRQQLYTESCTSTSRIVMFDHDGRPIYDRNCKGSVGWYDVSPDPVIVAEDIAEGIAPGKVLVFAVTPYAGDRFAMPLEVYGDKKGEKLIAFFGIALQP